MTTISGHAIPRAPAPARDAAPPTLVGVGRKRTATAARWLAGPAARWVKRATVRVRSAGLQAGGLGLVSFGAYDWHPTAGYVAAGVSLILFEYVLSGE